MKLQTLSGMMALAGVTVLVTSVVLSREPSPTTKPNAQEPSRQPPAEDAESQIETWVRHAMPAKQHKLLNRMAGNWDTLTRYWMKPGMPPVEAKGTCRRDWILDGRFLREELDGGDLAMPFRALAIYGYDRFEQKYTSAWVDTMSTAITTNMGTYDEAKEVVSFVGRFGDPWTGLKKQSRGLTRFVSDDKHVLELHVQEPDGQEFKTLEIVYTRKVPEQGNSK